MIVNYVATVEDTVALNTHIMDHSSIQQTMQISRIIISVVVVASMLLAVYLLVGQRPIFLVFVLLSLIFGGAIYYGYPRRIQQQMYVRAAKLDYESRQQNHRAPQTLTITVDDLELRSARGEERIPWAAIDTIASTDTYIFFYRKPTTALTVPDRAFTDREHRMTFLHLVQQYHTAALQRHEG